MTTSGFAAWLEHLGPGGLFLAATLDAFLPLGHIVDPLVIVLAWRGRSALAPAALATLGSTLGTMLFFLLVRGGSARFVRGRTAGRLHAAVARHGFASVLVGGVLPPPFPLKAVVVAAGLLRMAPPVFAAAFVLARGLRYGFEATLAARFGDDVLASLSTYPAWPAVALTVAIGVLTVSVAITLLQRRRRLAASIAPNPSARR